MALAMTASAWLRQRKGGRNGSASVRLDCHPSRPAISRSDSISYTRARLRDPLLKNVGGADLVAFWRKCDDALGVFVVSRMLRTRSPSPDPAGRAAQSASVGDALLNAPRQLLEGQCRARFTQLG